MSEVIIVSKEHITNLIKHYDRVYQKPNYFGYAEWFYQPYIKALISKAKLRKKSVVLELGSGQGFLAYLFKKNGMIVYGTDISMVGVLMAKETYCVHHLHFFVSDARDLPFSTSFDCIFTRGCSLHNDSRFAHDYENTKVILSYLKKNGTYILSYPTNLTKFKDSGWLNHCIDDVTTHFQQIHNIEFQVYFVNKLDLVILKKYSFNLLVTKINCFFTRILKTNRRGELVVFCKKVH